MQLAQVRRSRGEDACSRCSCSVSRRGQLLLYQAPYTQHQRHADTNTEGGSERRETAVGETAGKGESQASADDYRQRVHDPGHTSHEPDAALDNLIAYRL